MQKTNLRIRRIPRHWLRIRRNLSRGRPRRTAGRRTLVPTVNGAVVRRLQSRRRTDDVIAAAVPRRLLIRILFHIPTAAAPPGFDFRRRRWRRRNVVLIVWSRRTTVGRWRSATATSTSTTPNCVAYIKRTVRMTDGRSDQRRFGRLIPHNNNLIIKLIINTSKTKKNRSWTKEINHFLTQKTLW